MHVVTLLGSLADGKENKNKNKQKNCYEKLPLKLEGISFTYLFMDN